MSAALYPAASEFSRHGIAHDGSSAAQEPLADAQRVSPQTYVPRSDLLPFQRSLHASVCQLRVNLYPRALPADCRQTIVARPPDACLRAWSSLASKAYGHRRGLRIEERLTSVVRPDARGEDDCTSLGACAHSSTCMLDLSLTAVLTCVLPVGLCSSLGRVSFFIQSRRLGRVDAGLCWQQRAQACLICLLRAANYGRCRGQLLCA